jgi:ribosome-binding protein aMBF1 (putative translation factor)
VGISFKAKKKKEVKMRKNYEHKRRWGFDQEINILIAQKLKLEREKLGISQFEMAKRMNTSQVTISRIERAENNISLTKIERYTEPLGIDVVITFPIKRKKVNL